MKRFLALLLVWTLLVITGTLVSADGKTRTNGTVLNGTRDASVITDVTS
jgi:hypothetical protein